MTGYDVCDACHGSCVEDPGRSDSGRCETCDGAGKVTRPGVYRHYKGDLYRVLAVARESTNGLDEGKRVVVYVSMGEGSWYVRDELEFHALVTDAQIPRFVFQEK